MGVRRDGGFETVRIYQWVREGWGAKWPLPLILDWLLKVCLRTRTGLNGTELQKFANSRTGVRIRIHIHWLSHRCKKNVFTFFYFGHVFKVFKTFFLFSKRFLFKKRWQSLERLKHINKKHFQNNSNKKDLFHVEWPEMPSYKLLLTYYVWRIVWRPWRLFLGHQTRSWNTLRRGNVF